MPTYVYRREDGSSFEIQQRITEDALETCPETGQKVTRIISGSAGLIFKGSGFYLTDYARKNDNGSGETKAKTDGGENGSAKSSEGNSSENKSSDSKSTETKKENSAPPKES